MAYSDTSGLVSALISAFSPSGNESDPRGKIAAALSAYIVGNFDTPGTTANVESGINGDLSGMSAADSFPGKLSTAVTNAAATAAGAPGPTAAASTPPPGSPSYSFPKSNSASDAANHIASVTKAYVTKGTWTKIADGTPGGNWA